MIDSSETNSSSLGMQYELKYSLYNKPVNLVNINRETNTIIQTSSKWDIKVNAKGTIAVDSNDNPENFLEFILNLDYVYDYTSTQILSPNEKGNIHASIYAIGTLIKYETDQLFENKNFFYGFQASMYQHFDSHRIGIYTRLGRINPIDDTKRRTLLNNNLDTYTRADFEVVYRFLFEKELSEKIQDIELNYRYFKEIDANDIIKNENLDEYQMYTIRVGLDYDMFIAYSQGNLPFNQKDNQIFKIGFDKNLHNFMSLF